MISNAARIAIAAIGFISLCCFYLLTETKFDYQFESFFPSDDPDLEFYQDFRQQFEPDNDFILIGIENKKGIFNPSFLSALNELSDTLSTLKNVQLVLSPTNVKNPVAGPLGLIQVPYLHIEQHDRYSKDSARVYQAQNLVGTLFSKDAKAVTVYLESQPLLSKKASDALLFDIENTLAQFNFEEAHLAGRIPAQFYIIEKMKTELAVFIGISLAILILVLYFTFRAAWAVWVPLTVVILAAVWLLGLMSLLKEPINIVTTLLPTIMFVVGMSDIVHILSKYLEELRNGKEKIPALKTVFREVGFATFLTTFTTSIGFFTLITASIQPIREFGIYTGMGVFIAFFLAFTLLPSVLILTKKPKIAGKSNQENFWYRILHPLFLKIIQHRKAVLASCGALLLIAFIGMNRIKIDNYLLEDLKENDPHKQDFVFFEEKFAGVRPFEMAVWLKDSSRSFFDYEVLKEMEKMEKYLTEEYGAGFIMSPLSMVKSANMAINGGHQKYYALPESETGFQKIEKILAPMSRSKKVAEFISSDGKSARISAKMNDIGGYKIKQQNEDMQAFLAQQINNDLIGYKVTGTAMLIDKNNRYLARNMTAGLLIAFGLIALLMGLLFQSLKMILVALIPNIFPLLMIAGVMGITGIDLKVSTSIIFTIAFGIAVDDTIHFMSKLKLELNKGRSMFYAIKRTFLSTGKAIVVTSLILFTGFMTLIFSGFSGTFYIGVLISSTLLFAVIADLLLLPVLLFMFFGNTFKRDSM